MSPADAYIQAVIRQLPQGGGMRSQIAMELRAHVAEGVGRGRPVEDVLRQLGDARTLAESYLSAVPLVPGPLLRRLGAKVADVAVFVAAALPVLLVAGRSLPPEIAGRVVVATLVAASLGFGLYTICAEYWMGRTFGKRFFGLRVVRESGAAISFGQSLVRQLPMLLQVYWLDVLFAPFTERQQRAFELLSKTRVVTSVPPGGTARADADPPGHA